jgi:hypothetical protein
VLVLAGWLHCQPHGHSLWSEFEYRIDDHGGEPYISDNYHTTKYSVLWMILCLTSYYLLVNVIVDFWSLIHKIGHQLKNLICYKKIWYNCWLVLIAVMIFFQTSYLNYLMRVYCMIHMHRISMW